MKVVEIMTQPPVTVSEEATVDEVAACMIGRRVGCLPVVDSEGQLVGIVTTYDFGAKDGSCPFPPFCASGLADRQAGQPARHAATVCASVPDRTAREIMTPQPIALTEDATVVEAVAMMLHLGIDHIPVVRQGVPVGIVAREDLLRLTLRWLAGWAQEREIADTANATASSKRMACLPGPAW